MSETLDRDRCFFEIAQRPNLIFYHKGYFSHSIVDRSGASIEPTPLKIEGLDQLVAAIAEQSRMIAELLAKRA